MWGARWNGARACADRWDSSCGRARGVQGQRPARRWAPCERGACSARVSLSVCVGGGALSKFHGRWPTEQGARQTTSLPVHLEYKLWGLPAH